MRSYAYWLMLSSSLVTHVSAAPIKAGAAVMDITPTTFPMNMPGGFSANEAKSAHDPLTARALVLDDGKTKLAWVVIAPIAEADFFQGFAGSLSALTAGNDGEGGAVLSGGSRRRRAAGKMPVPMN